MTFYQELKEFFKKRDPQRLYMANKLARKFRKGSEQKVVMNRLEIIYNTGGPSKIVIEDKSKTAVINDEVIENVNDELNQEATGSVEVEIDIEGDTQDVVIDLPDDEEKEA